MSNYYVSGCVADGDDVSICEDSVAQFWTLYHRNEEGLSEGIIDCMFREDAEAAMRAYEKCDALAAENLRFIEDYKNIPLMRRMGLPTTPTTDAIKRQWMAEGLMYAINELPMTMSMAGKFNDLATQLRQPEEKGHGNR